MIRDAVICVIVDISVAPDDVAQFADDADKVYAEIFKTLPGCGSTGVIDGWASGQVRFGTSTAP